MNISDLDYNLPSELIAQSPASPRDHSRLLRINKKRGKISHHIFHEIENMLTSNDVLILNKTKVFPARFFGKKNTGGKIEVLLVEEIKNKVWKALTKPGLKIGQIINFENHIFKAIGHEEQTVILETDLEKEKLFELLYQHGKTPLPPYIKSKKSENSLRMAYQTVYADKVGSVAAPTAGLHFTPELLEKLKNKGVQIEYVTLHVGLGTFLPVKTEKLEDHPMHSEYFEIEKDVAERLNKAKQNGKRIIAVGSTSTRVLEALPRTSGYTNLLIYPDYKFKFVDALITNFHLPKSTLLAMVYALAGMELMKKAYKIAIKEKYRFFSFGDASIIE
ncbi:MAG TPA: tRNA preQ1(34) S-adenosylmethionine ribosyltransferase-isomerase QueA [Alphaproteobacteria bacterium]|jgi:S-adenosylmethionine:tRNA ribosyltransferase-isomerase|nr:tRNA preQ1(34) S-adenosylmethionine ribosyltransferase-isomerase QueA [Alphaproteobacteria bacterium]